VQTAFSTQTLPCATVGYGDTLIYTLTNPGAGTKTVMLTLTGSLADQENNKFGSLGNVCFASPSSFVTDNGTAMGGSATLNAADGLYYGNLPLCDDGDGDDDYQETGRTVVSAGTYPCINYVNAQQDTWATYTPASGSTPSTYTESFTTTASDPKAHG
jgi:hypothetical protein